MYENKSIEELIVDLEYFKTQFMLLSLSYEKLRKDFKKLKSDYNKLYFGIYLYYL